MAKHGEDTSIAVIPREHMSFRNCLTNVSEFPPTQMFSFGSMCRYDLSMGTDCIFHMDSSHLYIDILASSMFAPVRFAPFDWHQPLVPRRSQCAMLASLQLT